MEFSLPTGARDYFDGEANAVLASLITLPASAHSRRDQIDDDPTAGPRARSLDIDTFELIAIGNTLGVESQVYFSTGREWLGLNAESYPRYWQVVSRLAARPEFADHVSDGLIMNLFLAWLKGRRNGGLTADVTFTAHLLQQAGALVLRCTVYVPIEHLRSDQDWRVGEVDIVVMTAARIEAFESAARPAHPALLQAHAEAFGRLRERFLGRMFVRCEIEADRQKAATLALVRSETALIALRFFSPTAFVPEFPCYVGVMGRVLVPSHQLLVDSQAGLRHDNRSDERRMIDWPLTPELIDRAGLTRVGALLAKTSRSELEEACATALTMFDRGVTAPLLSDRIVFTLTAAEVLLLLDAREPIQGLLAFRLAHLAGATAAARPGIVEHLKRCYEMRSGYVHHGRSKHELAVVRELVNEVRMAILHVVSLCEQFRTRAELIAAIERQMLASSAPLA